ncbi:MAG: pyruvate, phosphate dikinase [Candidatus Limnocylindria bacterium]
MTFTRALDDPWDGTLDEARALVGGKAANLGVMARDLGLPVPPGFVITTAACRAVLDGGDWPAGLEDEVRTRMAGIEAAVGRRFGDAADPLLVSVRSGAPVSMPGMMDTVLDLGLNEATTTGLARAAGDEAFALACRERFESSFRSIVGVEAPADPWQQLRLAIEAVFRSWQSERARAYRRREGIPDDLGTAVTVQAMVFGNRGADSATGVLFTRDPATGAPELYGDILFDAQGEDVVAGTHRTEPIAAIDERLPAVGAALREVARRLERHYADLCDIEFTIEDGTLWMLQVRVGKRSPQAALRIAVDMAEDPDFPLSRAAAVERVAGLLADPPRTSSARSHLLLPIATGLPASPGLASGPVATDPAAAVAAAERGTPAILVRAETSPDDVHGMAVAAGVLTSRGGLASHAAVVARGWGIPAVVGAAGVVVGDGRVLVGERQLLAGDPLTIDGSTGEVFEGAIPSTSEVVPEARTLLAWAAEAGIAIGAAADPGPDPNAGAASPGEPTAAGPRPAPARRATPDDALVAIALKGVAPTPAIADALAGPVEAIQPVLDQLAIDGLIAPVAGAHRLTDAGTARVADLYEQERSAWGLEAAGAALDAFVGIDRRVKDVVTAWQLRDPATQVLNDHSDPDYDRDVLDRLAAVHAEALAWLDPVAAAVPRLATYATRLQRAVTAAAAGDGRFVASPRVDSYHGIWFELHEEIIQLAGRTRAEEVEAGRA